MSSLCLTSVLLVLLTCLVTVIQCERTNGSPLAALAFCWDPLYKGPCKDRKLRWFFNSESGLCKLFVYGGCLAKRNHFLKKDKCLNTCSVIESKPERETLEAGEEPESLESMLA